MAYSDQAAGPPVVVARWPDFTIMLDPRDMGL
jgi:hypothetical protein